MESLFLVALSIIFSSVFAFIGYFLFKKIEFTQNFFSRKQNIIYLTIAYFVIGLFLGQLEPDNTGIAFQIAFSLGILFSSVMGALLSTVLIMKSQFSIGSSTFYYCLSGSIVFGLIVLLLLY